MQSKFRGSLLGLAYADALGAGYEFFKGTIGEDEEIELYQKIFGNTRNTKKCLSTGL